MRVPKEVLTVFGHLGISLNKQKIVLAPQYYNPCINSYGLMEALDKFILCVLGWLSVQTDVVNFKTEYLNICCQHDLIMVCNSSYRRFLRECWIRSLLCHGLLCWLPGQLLLRQRLSRTWRLLF